MREKTKNILFYCAAGFLILAGVYLRVLFFSYSRPFWNDESALALNLLHRSYLGLFLPLDFHQAVPPLYSCLCKFCSLFIPKLEYAFRFPALCFSCGSVFLFFVFAKTFLKRKLSQLLALILFVFNYQLIYYAQELKPYSCDVFMFLAILLSYFYFEYEKFTKTQKVLFSSFLALTVWFSYTAVFALIILGIMVFVKYKSKCLTLFIMPFLSAGMLVLTSYKTAAGGFMQNFWKDGFISYDFSNLFSLTGANLQYYFPAFPNKIIIVFMLLAGLFIVFKEAFKDKDTKSMILLSAVVFAIALSYFHIYPLYLRTCLYLFPIIMVIMSKPVDIFNPKNNFIKYFLLAFVFSHFTLCTLKTDIKQIVFKQYYQEATAQLLKTAKQMMKKDDVLVVLNALNYEIYKNTVNINPQNVYILKDFIYDYNEIEGLFSVLPKGKTYYLISTHSGDKILLYKNLERFSLKRKNAQIYKDKDYNMLLKVAN